MENEEIYDLFPFWNKNIDLNLLNEDQKNLNLFLQNDDSQEEINIPQNYLQVKSVIKSIFEKNYYHCSFDNIRPFLFDEDDLVINLKKYN